MASWSKCNAAVLISSFHLIANYFQAILSSELSATFVAALGQKTLFSCTLFRLLALALAKQPACNAAVSLTSSFHLIAAQIQQVKMKSPLTSLIQQYINKLDKSEVECEREVSLVDQWVHLTDERNAVIAPTAGSGVPGAPHPPAYRPPPGTGMKIYRLK